MAPGDRLHARVSITGHQLTMTLQDLTRHWTFTKHLTVTAPDERSAEWIVEDTALNALPNQESPLASFTPVTFTDASAREATGTSGTLDTLPWTANKIAMVFGTPARLRAWPSNLTAGGSSFTVTAADRVPPPEPPPPV